MKFLIACLFFTSVTALADQPAIGVFYWDKPAGADAFSTYIGQNVTLGQSHQPRENWSKIEGEGWQLDPWGAWVKAAPNRVLNLSVVPFPPGGNLWQCADGSYDAHYQALAANLIKRGLDKTIIRFGWEWSGGWFYWNSNNGKEEIFGKCFARFARVMKAQNPNFKFDWNPNWDVSTAVMDKAWPGDAYVDYIGVDMYDANWNGSYTGCAASGCDEVRAMRGWTTSQLPALNKFKAFAVKHNKPLSFPEWGLLDQAHHGAGDNPFYIRNMLTWFQDPTNKVAYQSYFNINNPAEGNLQLNAGTHAPKSEAEFQRIIRLGGKQSLEFGRVAPAPVPAPAYVLGKTSGAVTGTTLNIAAALTSPVSEKLIIQAELRNRAGDRTFTMQRLVDQSVVANQPRSFGFTFTNIPAGTYRIDTAVYSATWKLKAYRNDFTFVVP